MPHPLRITIPAFDDLWDERSERFITVKGGELVLAHSLVSISKFEQEWKRPFLSKVKLTDEQIMYYIEHCMSMASHPVDPMIYKCLPAFPEVVKQITDYMEDPMTATTFNDRLTAQQSYKNRSVTSEEIYYVMASNNIPIEFQKWHLNRLLALLRVFEVKNTPQKKRSQRDIMKDYAAINAANKAKFNTKG